MKSNSSFTPLNSATFFPFFLSLPPPPLSLFSHNFLPLAGTYGDAGWAILPPSEQVIPRRPRRFSPPRDRVCHLSTSGSQILSTRASFSIPEVALAPSGACELKIDFSLSPPPPSSVFFSPPPLRDLPGSLKGGGWQPAEAPRPIRRRQAV